MKTKQIEKADTSKRLPWRRTWAERGRSIYLQWCRIMMVPPWDGGKEPELTYTLEDLCHNVPREPHTQTVLYARDVWQRPAKLMPFKPWDANIHFVFMKSKEIKTQEYLGYHQLL